MTRRPVEARGENRGFGSNGSGLAVSDHVHADHYPHNPRDILKSLRRQTFLTSALQKSTLYLP